MSPYPLRLTRSTLAIATVTSLLTACGGGSDVLQTPQMAATAQPTVGAPASGATPNIAFVPVSVHGIEGVEGVRFTIAPKPGATAGPLSTYYTADYLRRNGYIGAAAVTVPLFGLYGGRTNSVALDFRFQDGSSALVNASVDAPALPQTLLSVYTPTVVTARQPQSSLALDYFLIKSSSGPLIMDTDGELRWTDPIPGSGTSSTFFEGGFVVGDQGSTALYRLELDGRVSTARLLSSNYLNFHHNIEAGRYGLLMELNNTAPAGSSAPVEVSLADTSPAGAIFAQWNLENILRNYMAAHGDDPSNFVRSGTDWFHTNSAIYDQSSNTLIVSGREDFVIGLDYDTSDIKWILGDPTKYWATFPSLRAKALTLSPGSLVPIGQHALSITHDGLLMMFNDGAPSFNQPVGAPQGEARTYSAVSAYRLDLSARTAKEVWHYDHGQNILSDICSSAYELPDQGLLVDYAVADQRTQARLIALDKNHNTILDFIFPTTSCNTAWNALPVDFTDLHFE